MVEREGGYKEPKSFRLAPDVIDLLMQAVRREMRTQTNILEEALREYLGQRGYKAGGGDETSTGSDTLGM